jgi:hypothetical protein
MRLLSTINRLPLRSSLLLAAVLTINSPGATAVTAPMLPSYAGYADLADLALSAPVIVLATITSASRLKPEESPGVKPGHVRFYVTARVTALLKGRDGVPPDVSYLADVPLDAQGRPAKLRKAPVILFAAPVPGRPGELRLAAPDAQIGELPEVEARLRKILLDAIAHDAPPRITGIGSAFHVPGAVPGESETQIFLTTADQRPVSLSILRRPGEEPHWAVALSEMTDEAALPPARDTLLWYRLACSLPAALPDSSTADLSPDDARAASADYDVVIAGLGPCERRRTPN